MLKKAKYLITLIFVVISSTIQADNLIVYVNNKQPIDQYFIKTYLEEIKNLSLQYELEFVFKNVNDGAPKEITITPQIVFQNESGRSYFVGRFSEITRLANFIRTVRNNPQKAIDNKKQNILTLRSGKAITVLPIKFTKLKGASEITIKSQNYLNEKSQGFFEGFSDFTLNKEVVFERTNRAFYLDVHPYKDDNDSLFLSYEIYSQFNCVQPVVSKLNKPLKGAWINQEILWKKLGSVLEEEVKTLINNDLEGDGFSAINTGTPEIEWPAVISAEIKTSSKIVTQINNKWEVDGPLNANTPLIQFNFMAPLDNYAGEVKKMDGNIFWKDENLLSGKFKVNTKDVTMGEASYDKNVHKKYLKVFRFPIATFEFNEATVPIEEILSSDTRAFIIDGKFTMMKKSYPVKVKASLEPFSSENGDTKLLVIVNFDVNIFEKFSINGPDGPQEAKRNMHFAMQFLMKSNSK